MIYAPAEESEPQGRWKQPGEGDYLRKDKVKLTPGSPPMVGNQRGDAEVIRLDLAVLREVVGMSSGEKVSEGLH